MPEIEALAIVLVRLLGTGFVCVALVQAVANLLDSVDSFQPEHMTYYLRSQFLRPTVLNVIGILLLVYSRTLGGWLVVGLAG